MKFEHLRHIDTISPQQNVREGGKSETGPAPRKPYRTPRNHRKTSEKGQNDTPVVYWVRSGWEQNKIERATAMISIGSRFSEEPESALFPTCRTHKGG